MTMPDKVVNNILEEARHGGVKVTGRGRTVTVRFGLPPGRILRNYDDTKDEWLCIRKIYRDGGYRWENTGLATNWKGFPGYDPALPVGAIRSGRICSRFKSRARLEGAIRSMSQGSGGAYIEVLPWREDQNYDPPRPFAEIENSLSD